MFQVGCGVFKPFYVLAYFLAQSTQESIKHAFRFCLGLRFGLSFKSNA